MSTLGPPERWACAIEPLYLKLPPMVRRPWRMRGSARAPARIRVPSLPRFACADGVIPLGCVALLAGLAGGQRFSIAEAS
jgi:hypothetical protein